jgi:hypothetical protein
VAHPPPYPDSGDDADVNPYRRANTGGTPRWLSALGIGLVVALVVLVVVLHLTGTIGPGAH